jgi:cell division protein FtsB
MKTNRIEVAKLFFFIKYFVSVWFVFMLYAVLTLSIGSKGISNYRKLDAERTRLQRNFDSIAETNAALSNINILLGSRALAQKQPIPADPETLRVTARDLGYGEQGEFLIRVIGLGDSDKKVYPDAGEAAYAIRAKGVPDYVIKIVSICGGIALFLCLTLPDILGFCRYLQDEQNQQPRGRRARVS